MKLVLCAGAVLALVTTAAFADQFAGMYGNTLHITDPKGATSTALINADHTWEQRTADGKTMRGTYTWKDDTHFCIVVTDPAPKPDEHHGESCDNEISGNHKAGDTWTVTDKDGTVSTLSITAGR